MSPERFDHLLLLVGPHIIKKHCRSRQTFTPAERLTITLRYLASGDSQQCQSFNFRIGRTTVWNIIRETCAGIWSALYRKFISNLQRWKKIKIIFRSNSTMKRETTVKQRWNNDAHIFNNSEIGKAFLANEMNVRLLTKVSNYSLSYVIVSWSDEILLWKLG